MTKKQFVSRVWNTLHDNGEKKSLPNAKATFTIIDEDGHEGKFNVRLKDRREYFNEREIMSVFVAVCDVLADACRHGEEVYLPGVGKFSYRLRKARPVKHFGTDQYDYCKEAYVPKFTFSNILKEAVMAYSASMLDSKNAQRAQSANELYTHEDDGISPELRELMALDEMETGDTNG